MKKIINKVRQNYILIIAAVVLGVLIGWIVSPSDSSSQKSHIESHEGHDHESEEATTWTCSMHPHIKQDKPGLCPICAMDLVPLSSLSGGDNVDPNEIVMTEAAAKLADIQTMVVSKGKPSKAIYLQGKVQPDERNIAELTARFGGRIEKLFVNFTGQTVRKGQRLAAIYSPDLVTAQRELLEAIKMKESYPSLYNAAVSKLKLWNLNDKQIEAIVNEGEPMVNFEVLSPISGTVTMRHVSIGEYVTEGTSLFEVINLSKLWVMFDAYESDLPWIKIGDKVSYTLQALPGKKFESKVTYIDPFIDPRTRVAKVRVEVSNKSQQIKPEMFANGIINSKFAENGKEILVPKSSILWTGKRAIVYVKVPNRESPSFIYREVTLGPEAGSFFVVSNGLEEGEEIAINGVFKIDAASQLVGLPSMMNPDGGAAQKGHNHGGESTHTNETSQIQKSHVAHIPIKFKKQLTAFYDKYIDLTEALVDSDPKKVKSLSKSLLSSLSKIDMSLLEGDAHLEWMEYEKDLKEQLKAISSQSILDLQRKHFSTFNLIFYKTIKSFGIEGKTAYYQYCPMANNDKGGYWFSNTKDINNPYFGESMLRCGETKEILK